MSGLVIVAVVLLVAALAPLLAPHDPVALDPAGGLQLPSSQHLLGTDQLGRDILSRLIWGARFSLGVAVSAIVVGAGIGIASGLVSGYFGGTMDLLVMRLVDVLLALPMYLLALIVTAILGPSLLNTTFAIAVGSSARFARLIRGEVLKQRQALHVEAGRALGAGSSRIMRVHILPNVLDSALVMGSLLVGTAILVESTLSFLGLGLPPPTPAWGLMISEGLSLIRVIPWVPIVPGVAIALTVLGLNMLGDGLRDALDPRMREER
jgi:peptide/nickel transport system permease protein